VRAKRQRLSTVAFLQCGSDSDILRQISTETCLPRQNNARLNAVLLEYVIKADYKGESDQFVFLVHGIRFFSDIFVCVRTCC
jgi:hypothetical protein